MDMTPQQLVDTLGRLVPGFAAHWAAGDSLYLDAAGGFTAHGAFSEFSGFVREKYRSLPPPSVQTLGAFISECLEGVHGEVIGNAAATCFLENLAGEEFHDSFSKHLRPEARTFYDTWGHGSNNRLEPQRHE